VVACANSERTLPWTLAKVARLISLNFLALFVRSAPATPVHAMNRNDDSPPRDRPYHCNPPPPPPPSHNLHHSPTRQRQPYPAQHWASSAFAAVSNMLPMNLSQNHTMSSSPNEDVRNVSDDRIHPTQGSRRTHENYEMTTDGDVVVVQPSFDDDVSKSPSFSPGKRRQPELHLQDWQHPRSPQQDDGKLGDMEPRNPASPPKERENDHESPSTRHTRDLSAHFFDATSLNRSDSSEDAHGDAKGSDSRKHRRMTSGGHSNPNYAHRRLNSMGSAAAVSRRQHTHHREPSAGLDILSAAVVAAKDNLERDVQGGEWVPPESLQPPNLHGYEQQHRGGYAPYLDSERRFVPEPPQPIPPPPAAVAAAATSSPYYPPRYASQYPTTGFSHYPSHSYYPPGFPNRPGYPPHQYPSQHSMYPPVPKSGLMFPPENRPPTYRSVPEGEEEEDPSTTVVQSVPLNGAPALTKSDREPIAMHQGSQTFVTAMAVGGNKTLRPTKFRKHAAANTDSDTVPMHVSHHRKMSSFSSVGLGTIFGPPSAVMSPSNGDHPLKGHHRSTSSSVSFMNSLDVAGMDSNVNDTFLRNLHESVNVEQQSATTTQHEDGGSDDSDSGLDSSQRSGSKRLASGGTSKRVRRKCTISGCANRVVQGGLCIAHGAKRKICNHPGCNKNVKKAGLCSTHGPARKKCEQDGCQKVAVQGGRCIAHGARKKLCCVGECSKQAILGGMCKKHHDQQKKTGGGNRALARKKVEPGHTRGLSIFHDISADTVQSLLNAETVAAANPPPPPPAQLPPPRNDVEDRNW
jgi:hypothetical protein